MTAWSEPAKLRVDCGIRRWQSKGDHHTEFHMHIGDNYSGLPILDLVLTPEQFMSMLSGSMMMDVRGELAVPSILEYLGQHRHQLEIPLPAKLYSKHSFVSRAKQDASKREIIDWFEEQDGSAEFDGYEVRWQDSHPRLLVWKWYTKSEWEAILAKNEEADEVDLDADG